jgi:hypothetical protein
MQNNSLKKKKPGNTDLMSACLVCTISITYKISVTPPALLASTFLNKESHASLCPQEGQNQFQHLL